MMSRYDAHGVETEFEPGSRGRVLRNLLGIRYAREMSRAESEALLQAHDTRCHGRGLFPHDGYFPRRGLPLFAPIRPVALERLTVRGALLEKGWRIPSTAEDVLADTHRPSLRTTVSRK